MWEDGSPGRAGFGQVSEFAQAIAPDSIGFWIGSALEFGVQMEGPRREFGETLLRLRDPDGIVVKLVGVALEPQTQPSEARGIPARAAATMMLHPGAIRRAMLFRPSLVLSHPSGNSLTGTGAVLIQGSQDEVAAQLSSPEKALRDLGARVEVITVPAAHALADADVEAGITALGFLAVGDGI